MTRPTDAEIVKLLNRAKWYAYTFKGADKAEANLADLDQAEFEAAADALSAPPEPAEDRWPGGLDASGFPLTNAENSAAVSARRAARGK